MLIEEPQGLRKILEKRQQWKAGRYHSITMITGNGSWMASALRHKRYFCRLKGTSMDAIEMKRGRDSTPTTLREWLKCIRMVGNNQVVIIKGWFLKEAYLRTWRACRIKLGRKGIDWR